MSGIIKSCGLVSTVIPGSQNVQKQQRHWSSGDLVRWAVYSVMNYCGSLWATKELRILHGAYSSISIDLEQAKQNVRKAEDRLEVLATRREMFTDLRLEKTLTGLSIPREIAIDILVQNEKFWPLGNLTSQQLYDHFYPKFKGDNGIDWKETIAFLDGPQGFTALCRKVLIHNLREKRLREGLSEILNGINFTEKEALARLQENNDLWSQGVPSIADCRTFLISLQEQNKRLKESNRKNVLAKRIHVLTTKDHADQLLAGLKLSSVEERKAINTLANDDSLWAAGSEPLFVGEQLD
ncbi:MAG: hypothetical protein ACHQT8_01615 [Chlamydiales bacterium]